MRGWPCGPQADHAAGRRRSVRSGRRRRGICGRYAVVTDEIERGNAVVIASDRFTVDNAGARVQPGERINDQREATGEVIARTAIESDSLAVLAGNDAKAVVLDLVQPLAAGRQFMGFGWEARRDEPGREGTLQHNADS